MIAAFFTIVFSLNTVVGFACSVGLDMGFNSKHHSEKATEAVVHTHADGKKHIHQEKKTTHVHADPMNQHSSGSKKDNCCNDEVASLVQTDKVVTQSFNLIHPVFLLVYFDAFSTVALPPNDVTKDIKQFVRSYHPPIPDIRIAIQSFQI